MVRRGKYICPDCGKTYKWISETRHRLYGAGLPDVVDCESSCEVRVSICSDGGINYLSGNCPCGYPFYISNELYNEDV